MFVASHERGGDLLEAFFSCWFFMRPLEWDGYEWDGTGSLVLGALVAGLGEEGCGRDS